MLRTFIALASVVCLSVVAANQAEAQLVPRVVHYGAPQATFVQPAAYVQPTVVYRPALRPVATFAQPVPQAVYYAPQPAVYAPRPVVVARPTIPVAVVAPAPVVTQRYRPILGGTVYRQW